MENCFDCAHKVDKSYFDRDLKLTLLFECAIGNNEKCLECVESCKHLKSSDTNVPKMDCYKTPKHLEHLDIMLKKADEILGILKK